MTKENYIIMCVLANHADGKCQYAICEICHQNSKAQRGFSDAPLSERRQICHHEMHNLHQEFGIWWCEKKKIGSADWKVRPKGCVGCGKMFLLDK